MRPVKRKPIHMTNGDVTRTICGLSVDSPTAFAWVIQREEYKRDVSCKRCLFGLKMGWSGIQALSPSGEGEAAKERKDAD